jgi:hypothetical protein
MPRKPRRRRKFSVRDLRIYYPKDLGFQYIAELQHLTLEKPMTENPMTAEQLQEWRARMGLTLAGAAAALGHGEASLKAMCYGIRPISRTTQLLAEALDQIRAADKKKTRRRNRRVK